MSGASGGQGGVSLFPTLCCLPPASLLFSFHPEPLLQPPALAALQGERRGGRGETSGSQLRQRAGLKPSCLTWASSSSNPPVSPGSLLCAPFTHVHSCGHGFLSICSDQAVPRAPGTQLWPGRRPPGGGAQPGWGGPRPGAADGKAVIASAAFAPRPWAPLPAHPLTHPPWSPSPGQGDSGTRCFRSCRFPASPRGQSCFWRSSVDLPGKAPPATHRGPPHSCCL